MEFVKSILGMGPLLGPFEHYTGAPSLGFPAVYWFSRHLLTTFYNTHLVLIKQTVLTHIWYWWNRKYCIQSDYFNCPKTQPKLYRWPCHSLTQRQRPFRKQTQNPRDLVTTLKFLTYIPESSEHFLFQSYFFSRLPILDIHPIEGLANMQTGIKVGGPTICISNVLLRFLGQGKF